MQKQPTSPFCDEFRIAASRVCQADCNRHHPCPWVLLCRSTRRMRRREVTPRVERTVSSVPSLVCVGAKKKSAKKRAIGSGGKGRGSKFPFDNETSARTAGSARHFRETSCRRVEKLWVTARGNDANGSSVSLSLFIFVLQYSGLYFQSEADGRSQFGSHFVFCCRSQCSARVMVGSRCRFCSFRVNASHDEARRSK